MIIFSENGYSGLSQIENFQEHFRRRQKKTMLGILGAATVSESFGFKYTSSNVSHVSLSPRFLRDLQLSPTPQPGTFKGRGIVMSGGQGRVLQALSNLDVLRNYHGSALPVEFWHYLSSSFSFSLSLSLYMYIYIIYIYIYTYI